jgi:uncharacterized surface protein with fasciclin (FAS1) repeats
VLKLFVRALHFFHPLHTGFSFTYGEEQSLLLCKRCGLTKVLPVVQFHTLSIDMLSLLVAVLFLGPIIAADEDLLTALSEHSSLTKFTSLISNYSSLLATAEAGDMTILAPTDEAFDTFFSDATTATNFSSYDEVEALLSYHILRGVHSQASISSTPSFIPTLLTNSSYANVTGGQVVEAVIDNSVMTFISAVNCISKVVGPTNDIIFLGGLIHIIDEVLV